MVIFGLGCAKLAKGYSQRQARNLLQIHSQENKAPTVIDTIATGHLRAGFSKSVTLPSCLRGYSFLRLSCPSGLPISPKPHPMPPSCWPRFAVRPRTQWAINSSQMSRFGPLDCNKYSVSQLEIHGFPHSPILLFVLEMMVRRKKQGAAQ